METLLPPDRLVLSDNAAENWRRFKQRIQLYFKATGEDSKPSAEKAAVFLHVAGHEAIEVYNTFQLSQAEQEDYDVIAKKFEEYCTPQRNETYERYVFRSRLQQQDETFEQFLRDVQTAAQACNFGDLRDSMVRDQLVCGTKDKKLRSRLLREKDLSLSKAIDLCKAAELAANQEKLWDKEESTAKACRGET